MSLVRPGVLVKLYWLCVPLLGCASLVGVSGSDEPDQAATSSGAGSSSGEESSSGAAASSGSSSTSSSSSSASSSSSSSSSSASSSSSGGPDGGVRFVDLAYAAWPLPPSHPLPTQYDVANGSVYDRVTGLTWEQSPSFTPELFEAASNHCATLSLAGYTDWRVPSRIELISLLDAGVAQSPWIQTAAFPNTPNGWFWSQSESDQLAEGRWAVNFGSGYVIWQDGALKQYPVRCVRGTEQAAVRPVHWQAAGETVRDLETGLIWEKTPDPTVYDLAGAVLACQDLLLDGVGGFRVPTLRELFSLVDEVGAHGVDESYFARGAGNRFWTSTARVGSTTEQMVVDVAFKGSNDWQAKTDLTQTRVRCVKSP